MKRPNLKESSYSDYIAFADDSATFEEFLQKVKEQGLEGELPEEELKKIYTAHKDLNMKPTQVTEVLPKDADAGEYIADFEKSKAPQFKRKSKKKRREMAIAAFMNKQGKMKKEDILQAVKEVLAEKKATYCGRCGHTHVKGTPCPRPFKEGLSPYGDDAYFVTPNKGKKMTKEDILKAVKEVLTEATIEINTTDGTETTATPEQKEQIKKARTKGTSIAFRRRGDNTPLGEDIDLGHEDDEPHMIKSELYKVAKYALELYKMVDQFEGKGEVDFPAWWQSKITKATSMISSAKHYLEFELSEPAVDSMVGVEEAKKAKKLDPVGHEDADIDNDGDTDKTDKYLKNKRVKIGAAIAQAKKK
jgi:rubrerythrin